MSSRQKKAAKSEFPNTAPEEKSFRRSDGYYFAGKKLQPFSFRRQSAFLALLEVMGSTSIIEASAALWLMSQPDAKVKDVCRVPEAFDDEVSKFGEAHGILATNKKTFQEATAVYIAICDDLRAAKVRPVTGGDEDEEDEPDPN